MGHLSACNAESAIAICDPCYSDLRKKTKAPKKLTIEPVVKIRKFSYAELVASTNGFSAENFLGKGSHGSVYRAVLDGGKLIAAVKMTKLSTPPLASFNFQYNCKNSPVENEIEILSRVRNRRLVNLIGFCDESEEKKPIVVEYMPNGSLYDLLHSGSSRPPGWSRRVGFALHVAKAAQALHSSNPPVIHRDIKSSNVLIDGKFQARLGDFGLALRGHVEDVRIKCTPPAGTLGYLDPAYLAPSDLSPKSDVFSFGILLLEIISGRNAIDVNYSPPSVVDWAVPLIKRCDFSGICDERIGSPSDPAVIRLMAVLAARCVRSKAEKRPEMTEVVECLELVRKRVHAPVLWNSCRPRAEHVEHNFQPLIRQEVFDESEDRDQVVVRKLTRVGSRRNGKVSSVPVVLDSVKPKPAPAVLAVDRVVRSRSVGSSNREVKVGPDHIPLNKKKGSVAVKMPVMRLSKSRSTGVIRGGDKGLVHVIKPQE